MTRCLLWDKVYDNSDFTNNFSSRGSTVMVELSKSISQLCRETYQEQYELFFLSSARKRFENAKKLKSVSLFFCCLKWNYFTFNNGLYALQTRERPSWTFFIIKYKVPFLLSPWNTKIDRFINKRWKDRWIKRWIDRRIDEYISIVSLYFVNLEIKIHIFIRTIYVF